MKKAIVYINALKDIYGFSKRASYVEGDIVVTKGKFKVNGKSLLGLLSIDLTDGAIVEYPSTASDFEKYISNFKTKKN